MHSDLLQVNVSVSGDGYIRLRENELKKIEFKHLDTGVYQDGVKEGNACRISGYTEWVSEIIPTISIGWDWELDVSGNKVAYNLVGKPFSNVLISDDVSGDLSYERNLDVLSRWVHDFDWTGPLQGFLEKKYT